MGAFSSAFFSALLGIVGCAKLLQAIARDNLLSFLTPFAKGTALDDEPTIAILVTYLLTQATLFSNINQIASFVTMTFLLTFMVVNLACFLLKYISALTALTTGCQVRQTSGQVFIISDGTPLSRESLFPLLQCTSSMAFTLR